MRLPAARGIAEQIGKEGTPVTQRFQWRIGATLVALLTAAMSGWLPPFAAKAGCNRLVGLE